MKNKHLLKNLPLYLYVIFSLCEDSRDPLILLAKLSKYEPEIKKPVLTNCSILLFYDLDWKNKLDPDTNLEVLFQKTSGKREKA